jgi:hypothetical protein
LAAPVGIAGAACAPDFGSYHIAGKPSFHKATS